MLAYYFYPFAHNRNVREYTEAELKNPAIVEEVFDYCQIREAQITEAGWAFLIQHYGYEKLFEIDKRSGWLSDRCNNTGDITEYIEWVKYEREITAD